MFDIKSKVIVSDNKLGIVTLTIEDLLKNKRVKYLKDETTITDIGSYILSYNTMYRKFEWDQIVGIKVKNLNLTERLVYNIFYTNKNTSFIANESISNNRIFTVKGFVSNTSLKSTDAVLTNDGNWCVTKGENELSHISPKYGVMIETKYNKCCFVGECLYKAEINE